MKTEQSIIRRVFLLMVLGLVTLVALATIGTSTATAVPPDDEGNVAEEPTSQKNGAPSSPAEPEPKDEPPAAADPADELFVVDLSSNERYAVDAEGLEPVKRLTIEQVRAEHANGPNGPVEEEVRQIFIHDIGVNPNALFLHYNATPGMPHKIESVKDLVEGGKVVDGAKYSEAGKARYNELKPKLESAKITITPEVKYDTINTGIGPNGPTYSEGVSGDKRGVDVEYADGKGGLTGYSVLARCKNITTTSAPPAGAKPGYTDEHFGIGTGYGPPSKPKCVDKPCNPTTPPPPPEEPECKPTPEKPCKPTPPCEGEECNPEPPCEDKPNKPCTPEEPPGEPENVQVCDPTTGEIITVPEDQANRYKPVGHPACKRHDECPNLPGDQPEGTDCNPCPYDVPEGAPCEKPPGTPDEGAEQQPVEDNNPGHTAPTPDYEEGAAEENDQQQGPPCSGQSCGSNPTESGTEVGNSDQGGATPAPPVVTPEEQPNANPQPQPNPDHDGSQPSQNPDHGTGGNPETGTPPADTPAQDDSQGEDSGNNGDPLAGLELP